MKRKEIKSIAARHPKFVEWSEEDQVFIGRCPSLFEGGVHGHDEAKVYAELVQAVEEWIEMLHDDGAELPQPPDAKRYSGKFMVRVEPSLHLRLAAKAQAEGESLNQFVARALVKA